MVVIDTLNYGRFRSCTAKGALLLAVAGSLYFTDVEIPEISEVSGGSSEGYIENISKQSEDRDSLKRMEVEDSEIIAIVQLCLKTTII